MSASASKKKRKELEQLGNAPQTVNAKKEQEQRKQTTRTILIFAAVVVVAAIALGLLIHGLNAPSFDTGKAVVTVGDQSISVPVYDYFYNNTATNFYSTYYNYGFIKPNTPLSQQSSLFGGGSYEDYFKQETNEQLKGLLNTYGEAVANGYKLSDEDKQTIKDALKNLDQEAETYGFSNVNKYLTQRFGEGCNEGNYEDYLKLYLTYAGYYQKLQGDFQPTAEALSAEYQKDPSAYDLVTFTYATTDVKTNNGADDTVSDDSAETGEPSETGETTPAVTEDPEAAKEAAKAEAEAKLENMDEGTSTVTYTKANATSMSDELAAWLFDAARKEGDTTVIAKNSDNTSFYSVRFDGRDDNNYKMVNAYVISIAKDEEEVAEGQVSAQEKFEKLTAGLDESMTDEAFETYVQEQGFDASVNRASKGTYDDVVTDFLFDENRKAGDFTSLTTDSTYYVVRFASQADETYQAVLCKNTLWSEFYNSIIEANELTVDEEMMKYANTDLTFYQNESSNAAGNEDATPEDIAG